MSYFRKKRINMNSVWIFSLGMLLAQPSEAGKLSGPFKIATGEIPPYTIAYDEKTKELTGIFGEIVLGALKANELRDQVTVEWLPWKRAQDVAQNEKNIIIFPLTRTEAREKLYKWVALIITVNCHAFTIRPEIKLSKISDLNKYRLGALGGSPPEVETKKLMGAFDEKRFEAVTTESANLKKLMSNRIDAWITQDIVATYTYRTEVKDKKSPELIKTLKIFSQPLWVAVSKETSDEDVAMLSTAFKRYLASPEAAKIKASYGLK